jgi:hypothetical protein
MSALLYDRLIAMVSSSCLAGDFKVLFRFDSFYLEAEYPILNSADPNQWKPPYGLALINQSA